MKDLKNDFKNAFLQTYHGIERTAHSATLTFDSATFSEAKLKACMESREVSIPSTNIVSQYQYQDIIRPTFGKEGRNTSTIGTHPDFSKLKNPNDQGIEHYICTMFIDLKSSTRLALLYDLKEVYRLKNSFLKGCIEIVRSFDGHVHRLMGDALMGFFGGLNVKKEDAIADAINCATTLHLFFKEIIIPMMTEQDSDTMDDFGFRIGLDFGDDEHVLWAAYGFDSVGEVTATGLQIDMASKLQSHAEKNQAMLGQTLLNYIDFPEEYLSTKTGDKEEKILFVEPNITDRNGAPLNYKMRMLNFENILRLSPWANKIQFKEIKLSNIKNEQITYQCYVMDGNIEREEYISMSRFLPKKESLKFKIRVITSGMRYCYPLKIVFTKTNYGKEARDERQDREFEPIVKLIYQNNSRTHNQNFSDATIDLDEATEYRGLHTMEAKVIESNGNPIFRDWIGVLIV